MTLVSGGTSVSQALQARRSVRKFHSRQVAATRISEIVQVALWAPSPHNSQPWRFVSLASATKSRLARAMASQLAAELEKDGLAASEANRLANRSIARIEAAPNALLICTVADGLVLTGEARKDELEVRMAIQSVGAVLQSLFLAAAERGIGSCWMAAPMYCPVIVRRELDLSAGWQPQALVLLGYPAHPGRQRPRLSLDAVLVDR